MDAAHPRGDVSRARTSQRKHLPVTVSITYFDPKNRWLLGYILKCHSPVEAFMQLAQLRGNSRASLHWLKEIICVCFDSRFSCQWPSALEVPAFGASGCEPLPESGWGSATKWASPCFNWGISCLCFISESSLHFLFECENWEWTAEKLEVRSVLMVESNAVVVIALGAHRLAECPSCRGSAAFPVCRAQGQEMRWWCLWGTVRCQAPWNLWILLVW